MSIYKSTYTEVTPQLLDELVAMIKTTVPVGSRVSAVFSRPAKLEPPQAGDAFERYSHGRTTTIVITVENT